MKRNIKNVFFIVAIILVGVCSYFTMKDVQSNQISENETSELQGRPGSGNNQNQPPQMSSGDFDNNMGEPPAKPEGENDADNENQMGNPPAKPDDENGNSQDGTEQQENMQTPPEMPNGNMGEEKPEGNMPNNMSSENSQSSQLKTIHYVIFGIEGLVFSILVIYLIMSKFNKLNFKETLSSSKRIIIYIVLIAVITAILTIIQTYITNVVFIKKNSNNQNQAPMMQRPGNFEQTSIETTGKTEVTEDTTISSGTYTSTESDEVAILANGELEANLSNIEVTKTGDSDGGDNTSFYGINSAILAKNGANLTLKDIVVTTNATGANGVFSYGGSATTNNSSNDGTTITISDSTITTTKDNSGGIMTTGGGTMKASNLTINTAGISSAAIRTDRGGGNVMVDGGTYTTTGQGSPTIYSTADVTVNDAKLVAKTSEGIVIEGKNSVTINNCDLTDSNTKLNGQSTTYKNIFLYQSMSGDAANGNAEFTSNNSTLTTNKGDSFYVTNTTATINLNNNTIVNNDSTGNLLRAKADSWGNSGSNGGNVTLNAENQELFGNIVIDDISTLVFNLKENSIFEGTINGDNTAKSIKLVIDENSHITLTGDTYVTELEDSDTSYSNINFNGYKLYVNGTAIN